MRRIHSAPSLVRWCDIMFPSSLVHDAAHMVTTCFVSRQIPTPRQASPRRLHYLSRYHGEYVNGQMPAPPAPPARAGQLVELYMYRPPAPWPSDSSRFDYRRRGAALRSSVPLRRCRRAPSQGWLLRLVPPRPLSPSPYLFPHPHLLPLCPLSFPLSLAPFPPGSRQRRPVRAITGRPFASCAWPRGGRREILHSSCAPQTPGR